MLILSFLIYIWLVALIKIVDKWIENFTWSKGIYLKKLVTVAWHKTCNPIQEGGLGIRSLRAINEADTFKLCWKLLFENSQWSSLIRARFFKNNKMVSYNVKSPIWSALRNCFDSVMSNVSWIIGDGLNINFWKDRWIFEPLVDILRIPSFLHDSLQAKMKDFIYNQSWALPSIRLRNSLKCALRSAKSLFLYSLVLII